MREEKKEKVKRISDLAKRLGMSNSAVLDILKEAGFKVRSAQSKLTKEMEKAVKEKLHELEDKELKKIEKKKEIWGVSQEKEEKKEPKRVEKKQRKEVKKPPKPRKKKQKAKEEEQEEKVIVLNPDTAITTQDFAKILGKDPVEIIQKAFEAGMILTINQALTEDLLQLLAEEFGYEVKFEKQEVVEEEQEEELDEEKPPVVTVMGHVDHGKTTLLDYIRHTKVAEQEVGRITQRIGAYQVEKNGKRITFIDTPGHEAFSAMRARGAQVTDIVVLVVAVTEGVKEQTVEAIDHAKAAGVPIIVALNKIDLPTADIERTKRELSEHGLIPEEWGGDTIMVPVSAKTGKGVDDLLESILLVAETLELKTTSKGRAKGVVLEAQIAKGMGPVATVIITRGTLRIKDPIVVGDTFGKIRGLINDRGQRIKEAGPACPVMILGLDELPSPGDKLEVVESEKKAKEIAQERKALRKQQIQRGEAFLILEKIEERIKKGELKELPLIVKADSHGSLEAVIDSLAQMSVGDTKPIVVHKGVGAITESDVDLASASQLIILGFNTQPDQRAKKLARERGVTIKTYKIIYHLLEDVENMLKGLVKPVIVEEPLGVAEVREVFRIAKMGNVAGCFVVSGRVEKGAMCRVKRGDEVLHEGRIISLKRFKDDVDVVKEGLECGLKVENFEKIKPGDILEVYNLVEKFEY